MARPKEIIFANGYRIIFPDMDRTAFRQKRDGRHQPEICRFDLDQGVEIPSHTHLHDQAGYVVSGRIRVAVDSEGLELGPGDSYCAPSGILHSAQALEKTVVVDTFSPPREDYRTHSKE